MGDPFPTLPSAAAEPGGLSAAGLGSGLGSGLGPGGLHGVGAGATGDWQPVVDETQRPSLSTLFQPPHDILFTGSFEQVRLATRTDFFG